MEFFLTPLKMNMCVVAPLPNVALAASGIWWKCRKWS